MLIFICLCLSFKASKEDDKAGAVCVVRLFRLATESPQSEVPGAQWQLDIQETWQGHVIACFNF